MKQKEPKFEIGDKVSMSRATLYGEKEGVIIAFDKNYKAVRKIYGDGRVLQEFDGLVQEEGHIKNIRLPYRFDGVTLEVDYPETDYGTFIQKAYTSIYEFCGYSYTVKTDKILTCYSERQLKKI